MLPEEVLPEEVPPEDELLEDEDDLPPPLLEPPPPRPPPPLRFTRGLGSKTEATRAPKPSAARTARALTAEGIARADTAEAPA